MKVAIISKTYFISNLIDFYLRSSDENIRTFQTVPQNIIAIDEEFEAAILESSELSGDITNLLEDIEMIIRKGRNRIILINTERIFYRNNGYTIFPPNGSLDILNGMLAMHQNTNKGGKSLKTSTGMEVKEILKLTIPSFPARLRKLGPRQKMVFKLLLTEFTYEQIAQELYVAVNTVKTHVTNIYKILEISNRGDLIRSYGYLLEELEQMKQLQYQ